MPHVRVYGGGGGTITPEEIEALHGIGVARIFSPEDGRVLGLEGMIATIVDECLEARRAREADPAAGLDAIAERIGAASPRDVGRLLTFFESYADRHKEDADRLRSKLAEHGAARAPVIGFTGTGGAGKSSVVDELVMRLRRDAPALRIALLLVDPTRRRSGGALLGDRIRMNAIGGAGGLRALDGDASGEPIALRGRERRTRRLARGGLRSRLPRDRGHRPERLRDRRSRRQLALRDDARVRRAVAAREDRHARLRGSGRAQQMRPPRRGRFPARHPQAVATQPQSDRDAGRRRAGLPDRGPQLERSGDGAAREGARGEARRARRGRLRPDAGPGARDPRGLGVERARPGRAPALSRGDRRDDPRLSRVGRDRAERAALADGACLGSWARSASRPLARSPRSTRPRSTRATMSPRDSSRDTSGPRPTSTTACARRSENGPNAAPATRQSGRAIRCAVARSKWRTGSRRSPATRSRRSPCRGAKIGAISSGICRSRTSRASSRTRRASSRSSAVAKIRRGCSRARADPSARTAASTCSAAGQPAARLSTAFDSVTLYGRDPDERPDIYGKVGNSGVSVCTLDDAKKLYSGFDLSAPTTVFRSRSTDPRRRCSRSS